MFCLLFYPEHKIEINRKATRVGTFEVYVSTHVSLRMFIMQVLASQLPFLANRNAELAVSPLFWPVNCIKIGGHVALLSVPAVYSQCCAPSLCVFSTQNMLPLNSCECFAVLMPTRTGSTYGISVTSITSFPCVFLADNESMHSYLSIVRI